MADSYVIYTALSGQDTFTVPFPYIQRSHVKVKVNQILKLTPADWTWLTDSSIKFRFAVPEGSAVEVYRETPSSTRLVDFQNGAVLTEAELDLAFEQNFYLLQETRERYAQLIETELLRIAAGQGVTDTDPATIVSSLVDSMLGEAAAIQLQQRVTDIDLNAENILSGDNALQVQINQLVEATAGTVFVQASMPVPGVGGVPDPIPGGARWYDTDDNNHPYIYDTGTSSWISIQDPRIASNAASITSLTASLATTNTNVANNASALSVLDTTVTNLNGTVTAQAASITQLQADVGTNSAAITTEQNARANGDTALSTSITNLTTTVDGNTATITTHAASISGLQTKYGVRLDVNGYVSGFVQNNSGTTSDFIVLADKFAVVTPGQAAKIPFLISGGTVYMQNVAISGNLLVDGTINGVKIAAAAVGASHLAANSVTASAIAAGVITADKLTVTQLSAINSNMGAITAGTITLNTSGWIKGGQTDYGTGTGFFLGYSGAAYKFSIGNSTDYLKWDGSSLIVKGNVRIGNYVAGSAWQLASAPTSRGTGANDENTWVTVKVFNVTRDGTVRAKATMWLGSVAGGVVQAGAYRWRSGGTVVASGTNSSTTPTVVSRDISLVNGQTSVSLDLKAGLRNTLETVITSMNCSNALLETESLTGEYVITD